MLTSFLQGALAAVLIRMNPTYDFDLMDEVAAGATRVTMIMRANLYYS